MKRNTSIFFIMAWNDYRIFQGVNRYAHEAGWTMDTRHFFLNICPRGLTFQGMIVMCHADPVVNAYIRKISKRVPTVILGAENPGIKAPMITSDSMQTGRMAADHLYSLYHKQYAWFSCNDFYTDKSRKRGFVDRLSELGFPCSDFSGHRTPFDAKSVLHKLRQSPKPVGVMACDDHDASVLVDLCQQAGLRVPEDVAIVGAGDLESLCPFSAVPISSINLNWEKIGFQSAAVLDQLMHGRSVPPLTTVPPGSLIPRQSTQHLALVNPHLKAATQLIDKKFMSLLTMDDIASQAGVSRRQLYVLFRDEMRRSPRDYLMEVRQRHAQQLIAEDKLALHDIAHRCGFNTPRCLHRTFIRHFGQSPSQWAKAQRIHEEDSGLHGNHPGKGYGKLHVGRE